MTDAIYFWKRSDTYGFMSNFYPCKFEINDIWYNCSEQFFMTQKCLTFEPQNIQLLRQIMSTENPNQIKAYGRQVGNFDQKVWDQKMYSTMKIGVLNKFLQNSDLGVRLLKTGTAKLYEASPYDDIWGIGYTAEDAKITPVTQYGQNLLGLCLEEIRRELLIEQMTSVDYV